MPLSEGLTDGALGWRVAKMRWYRRGVGGIAKISPDVIQEFELPNGPPTALEL